MDTQYNECFFLLKFIQISDSYTQEQVVTQFVPDEKLLEEIDREKIVKLKENITLKMQFTCSNPNARIFMDGIDMLPSHLIEQDNGEIYITPKEDLISIFEKDDYPMIPGFYKIIVKINEQNFYSKFEIVPTLLEEQEWEIMRNELEDSISGLAQDLIRKNLSTSGYIGDDNSIPCNLLYKFIIISKYSPKIVSVLQNLAFSANYRVKKTYKVLPFRKVKEIDSKTVIYRQMHPEMKNYYKVPVKCLNFDLPENRYVKKLIIELKRLIKDLVVAINYYIKIIQSEIVELERYNNNKIIIVKRNLLVELKMCEQKINKINFSIRIIENTEWYKETSSNINLTFVPATLLIDSRYRTLYQLNRELKTKDLTYILDEGYYYQWKRTDKLYEMWCFLQIHRILISEELKFKPVSGWIYDYKIEDEQIFIPVILPNTKIKYEKDDVVVNFVYDAVLPSSSSESDAENNPLYSRNNHNRPDGRLDIYKEGLYIGSILMDYKYRKTNRFWNYKTEPYQQPHNMKQLIAYADNCRSTYLYGDYINIKRKKMLRPVTEVWAIYPKDNKKELSHLYDDAGLRLIKFCPGKANEFNDILKLNIENIVEIFKGECEKSL